MSPSLILVIFLLLLSFGTIGCGILLKRIYIFTNGRWHRTREEVVTERKAIPRSFVLSDIIPKIGPRPLLLPIAVDNAQHYKSSSIFNRYHVNDRAAADVGTAKYCSRSSPEFVISNPTLIESTAAVTLPQLHFDETPAIMDAAEQVVTGDPDITENRNNRTFPVPRVMAAAHVVASAVEEDVSDAFLDYYLDATVSFTAPDVPTIVIDDLSDALPEPVTCSAPVCSVGRTSLGYLQVPSASECMAFRRQSLPAVSNLTRMPGKITLVPAPPRRDIKKVRVPLKAYNAVSRRISNVKINAVTVKAALSRSSAKENAAVSSLVAARSVPTPAPPLVALGYF